MLYWALGFLAVAVVAALFGFGVMASAAAETGMVVFVIAMLLFVVCMSAGRYHRSSD